MQVLCSGTRAAYFVFVVGFVRRAAGRTITRGAGLARKMRVTETSSLELKDGKAVGRRVENDLLRRLSRQPQQLVIIMRGLSIMAVVGCVDI
jgi:hypothetical protein